MIKVLSIAGFDPSGGAGILADIKVFHQLGVQGNGVLTGVTYQNNDHFHGLDWLDIDQLEYQLKAIYEQFQAVKIGIVPNLDFLNDVLKLVDQYIGPVPIIWDPVIKSSSGFEFLESLDPTVLKDVLDQLILITPNANEAIQLESAVPNYMEYVNVILKGGHKQGAKATDTLYQLDRDPIHASNARLEGVSKHGTGCAYSAVIAASIAKGIDLEEAFVNANKYVFELLQTGHNKESVHHEIVWNND